MDGSPHTRSLCSRSPLVLRQKRAHQKSRNGCLICKKRRVKCDETLPQCKVCSMRGIRCEYAEPKESHNQNRTNRTLPDLFIPSPSQDSVFVPESQAEPPKVARQAPDALLWQYYLAHAGQTIATTSTDPRHARMWATAIPAIAFSNPVTSHAMKAFSAFCLSASSHKEDGVYNFRATAELHYFKSVKSLRLSLPTVDTVSADAVLACAMILIPCGLALAQNTEGFSDVQDWFHHLRGWRALGSTIYASSPQIDSTASLIPYPQPGIPDRPSLPTATCDASCPWAPSDLFIHEVDCTQQNAIENLRTTIKSFCSEHDTQSFEPYMAAIASLEHVMDYVLHHQVTNLFRAVFTWPIYMRPSFVQLLSDHDYFAGAIYAHWLVLVMAVEDLWWLRGFGSKQIKNLATHSNFVSRPGSELLRWPVEMQNLWCSRSSDEVVQAKASYLEAEVFHSRSISNPR